MVVKMAQDSPKVVKMAQDSPNVAHAIAPLQIVLTWLSQPLNAWSWLQLISESGHLSPFAALRHT